MTNVIWDVIVRFRRRLADATWPYRPLRVSEADRERVRKYQRALGGSRMPFFATPVRLSAAKFATTDAVAELQDELGIPPKPSAFPELIAHYFDELQAIQSTMPTRPEPATPEEARAQAWQIMTEAAQVTDTWDEIANPFRFYQGHIVQISSANYVGVPPRLQVFRTEDFLAAVALRTSSQEARIQQLTARVTALTAIVLLSALVAYLSF